MNKGFYNLSCKPSGGMFLVGTFDTNNTSTPDGVTGDILSVARDDVGDFTVTLKHSFPQAVAADASIIGNEPTLDAKVGSLANISSGTLTVHVYEEDGTSGISASADTTDKTVQVWAFVRNTKLTTW